jgi:hypothetical protein
MKHHDITLLGGMLMQHKEDELSIAFLSRFGDRCLVT